MAMDTTSQVLAVAQHLHARQNGLTDVAERPPIYKVIGISLAVASGLFIGVSFVLKKIGLLKANEKYNEEAGEGYGFLKNGFWWGGMVLMILGEICNFVAYAFTDAILVTPLGALSVVITTILSAIFLKERLSMVGKVSCFLCLVGSVTIVMNAPQQSAVATIQQMQAFVVHPAFLSYAGVIIVGCFVCAFWAGPKWGKKNMLVYLSICSWTGGLSVVATQGLGAAVITQAEGTPQFNQWFLYVLLVFVIVTLLVEIIYLNKALNIFNAAMVTPTYYVYFTSTTIITSAVLFRGFRGSANEIVSVVMGFLTICAGVVLLQLSKSAKDVPDTAVFSGNLDQIHTIAEQEQSETDPKADAIRGTAAIVRRFSSARQKMEADELKRLHEEKQQEQLAPVSEDGPLYEWDGLRRRRTVTFSSQVTRARSATSPAPFTLPRTPEAHPPLGMARFPTEEELNQQDRPISPGMLSSIAGTIRTRARSVLSTNQPPLAPDGKPQSPLHPVALTEISVPGQKPRGTTAYSSDVDAQDHASGTEYLGAQGLQGHSATAASGSGSLLSPNTAPHSAMRQFSFYNVFRRGHSQSRPGGDGDEDNADQPQQQPRSGQRSRFGLGARGHSTPQVKGATEEERLGLVQGDSRSMPALPHYDDGHDDDDDVDDFYYDEDKQRAMAAARRSPSPPPQQSRYGRGITGSPPRRSSPPHDDGGSSVDGRRRGVIQSRGGRQGSQSPPQPPPHRTLPDGSRRPPPQGGDGAFI